MLIGVHKNYQQRKEEAPFKHSAELVKECAPQDALPDVEICWRGRNIYVKGEPVVTAYRGFLERHPNYAQKWCSATPEEMVKKVDQKIQHSA